MRPKARARLRALARTVLPPLVAFGALAGGWQLLALHNSTILPTIGQIADALAHNKELYAKDTAETLLETVVGLSMGLGAALVIGVAMSQVRLVQRALMPLLVVMNVTPLIALAPGLVVALGIGLVPKYVVAAIIVFFPFLINFSTGLVSVEAGALEVLRSIGASRREVLLRLQLPSSLPFLFAAARICFPLSLVGAVVAELTVSGLSPGLGVEIAYASTNSEYAKLYGAVVCLAFVGTCLFGLVVVTERRSLGWYRATRGALGPTTER